MKKINIQWIAETAILAALYAVLTWLLAPISYGAIQFRISEILVLLVVFKPSYCVALILGCFVANTTSSLGWYDMVFGTLATALAVLPMIKIRKLWVAAILPVLTNGIIVALELYLALGIEPIWMSMLTVALGEAVVLFFIGIPVMIAISKNEALVGLLNLQVEEVRAPRIFTLSNALCIALAILGIVLFIAYPLYGLAEAVETEAGVYESTTVYYSALTMVKENPWVALTAVIPVLYGISFLGLKKRVRTAACCLCALALFILWIFIGVSYLRTWVCPYYYGYLVYILLLLLPIGTVLKNKQPEAVC